MAWLTGIAALFTIYGGWTDVRARTIPNWLCAVLTAGGLAWSLGSNGTAGLFSHGLHFLIALGIGLALFSMRWWGGGDGKFYAAVAAWFPLSQALLLVFAISLAGVCVLVLHLLARNSLPGARSKSGVPYGLAIAVGAIATKAFSGVISLRGFVSLA